MIKLRFLVGLSVLLFSAPAWKAATFVVPDDRGLVAAADAIVVGTVIDSYAQRAANGLIQTVTELAVAETIKGGSASDFVRVVEWGGHLGNEWMVQSGAPSYVRGERVLLFLERNSDASTWQTWGLAMGAFRFDRDAEGVAILSRPGEIFGFDEDGVEHVERPRLEKPFLDYVRAVARGDSAVETYFAPVSFAPRAAGLRTRTDDTFTGSGYTIRFGSDPARRRDTALNVDWRLFGSQNGANMETSVDFGIAKWNNQSPKINYTKSATAASGDAIGVDSEQRVIANDPNSVVSGSCCPGTVATAFEYCSGPTCDFFTFNGEQFLPITHSDVVVNTVTGSLSQATLNVAMAHEMGHTLALRHSDKSLTTESNPCAAPLDCCINTSAGGNCKAVMNASVISSLSGLGQWDKNAIDCLYDGSCSSSTACNPATVTTHPQNKTIGVGGTTSLSVVAGGTSPFTYQWYIGASNTDDTNPIGGATSATLSSLSPAVTTKYWVKVTNSCGNASSNVATVTVQECSPPSITTQPQNKTITLGSSAKMSVGATGSSPLSYQWYTGQPGDTSTPIAGATTASPNIAPVATVVVWVRVTGQCAPVADSNAATITVNPCAEVVVGTPSATGAGTNWTLSVSATSLANGPLTYEWYKGSNPGSNVAPKVGEGSSLAVVVNTVTQYWARVTNACGASAVSGLVVVAPCQLPVIAAQPADRTIPKGGTTVITVGEVAEGISVQWYRGTAPDKTVPLSAGAGLQVVSLQETTSFWAALTNTCGEVPTRTVIVTVDDSCAVPVVTVQPADRTIAAGASTDLAVAFTGDNVTVQWYRGTAPDKSNPVAAGATITVGPLLATTSFWAALTNSCGEAASRTVSVAIEGTCERPVITTQPMAVQSVSSGATATLSVVATGTPLLKYQWFEGVVGATDKPVGSDFPLYTTPPLTEARRYWVRISNPCGEAISNGAEVKVGPGRRRAARH